MAIKAKIHCTHCEREAPPDTLDPPIGWAKSTYTAIFRQDNRVTTSKDPMHNYSCNECIGQLKIWPNEV